MKKVVLLLGLLVISLFTSMGALTVRSQPTNPLGIQWQQQRKDTNILCLYGCPESKWDRPETGSYNSGSHPNYHGSFYCQSAATAMIASYYGGQLSQDRIVYLSEGQGRAGKYPTAYGRDLPIEYYLSDRFGTIDRVLWALGFMNDPLGADYEDAKHLFEEAGGVWNYGGKPPFTKLKEWIDDGKPIAVNIPGHYMVIDGYRQDATGQYAHLLDPASTGPQYTLYTNINIQNAWACPSRGNAPNVRSDEDLDNDGILDTVDDSDGDGVCDFDENMRFHTDPLNPDTDGDQVSDKQEIKELYFDRNGDYSLRLTPWGSQFPIRFWGFPDPPCPNGINWTVVDEVIKNSDPDGDDVRKELDPDNDNDGLLDGEEDKNHNGLFEPELGETSNFDLDIPLTSERVKFWQWTSHTWIESVACGDVDNDGRVEIVTGGNYGEFPVKAQLCVWDGETLELENVRTWYWTHDTYIHSVAIGDVDGDGSVEIVTGGRYFDGTREVAQLCVWDGTTLELREKAGVRVWYWTSDTRIRSVTLGDVDGDDKMEIVTGGDYYDGTRNRAQLCIWNGATLSLEGVRVWYWTSDTRIRSVTLGDVDGDGDQEIVSAGCYSDGTRNRAQLCIWNGATLALEGVRTWYWVSSTYIFSVAVGDVDSDGKMEIVTGGDYYDGTRNRAQLCIWDGRKLNLETVVTRSYGDVTWYWSVTIGDVDGDGKMEIITGGSWYFWTPGWGTYKPPSHYWAQLTVWDGTALELKNYVTWFWKEDTDIYSMSVGDVDSDGKMEIVTGGFYAVRYTLSWAQLCVWG